MPSSESARQRASQEFRLLLSDEWEARMRDSPLFATRCGDHRFNDCLPSVSVEAYEQRLSQARGFLDRLTAMDRTALPGSDRLDYSIFARVLRDRIADYEFRAFLMPVKAQSGFHVFFPHTANTAPFNTVQDYEAYLARLAGFKAYAEEHIALMRAGMAAGVMAPRIAMVGVEDALTPHIVTDPVESVFFAPFQAFPVAVGESDRAGLQVAAAEAVLGSVVPGYQALLDFLTETYIPAARDEIGASALPDGRAYYEHCVRRYTSLDISPEEVHAIGLSEVRRIRDEMSGIIEDVGFVGDLQAFLDFLHTDPRFYLDTPEALLQYVALISKRIDGELPKLFNLLPRMPYGIREIPAYAAPKSTTAYYFPCAGDGSRAGTYYINTYGLESRPLYEYEALTLHEAVPGHHLQLALQMELDLPNFRRFGDITAFIEGWALYSERLGIEMGFYQDPYSDFGRLVFEMWRAARLVVDTGMHALGWTRRQGIDYMAENTALSLLNITNEIDRYIGWPGQALAYKIGELKISELRERAESELGTCFNVRDFHRILLEDGGVPLDLLEAKVSAWIGEILSSGDERERRHG